MNSKCAKIALTVAALLLTTNFAFAADTKVNPADNAKATTTTKADGTKAGAKDVKGDPKAAKKSEKPDAKSANSSKATKIVDINSATLAELKAIPGVGDAYAAKIIAGRPYAKKDQLKTRNILPAPAYNAIKDQITAKHAGK